MKKQSKWLEFSDIQLVSNMIRNNLKNRDFTKLEGAIYAGFEKLPKTRYYNKLLLDGILSLVNYYIDKKQHFYSLTLLEKARQSFPINRRIVKNEIRLLDSIFIKHNTEFVERDYKLLEAVVNLLLDTYQKGFPNDKAVLENLKHILNSQKDNSKIGVESKITFHLERFLLNLYGELSKDQQIEEFVNVITPEILKWIAENLENDSDEVDDTKSEDKKD